MASPPFSLNTSAPANTDIAANFPTLDRSDKDVIQSWFLVQQNDLGHNVDLLLDQIGSANGLGSDPTPSAGTAAIYYDTTEVLMEYRGDIASAIQLSVPIGCILDFAGSSAPNGYVFCGGQAISRSTYAVLFALIGTTYGSGDGSTTFNVPDCRGYVLAGVDNMGGSAANRITNAGSGIVGTTLGATGGSQNHTLVVGEMASGLITMSDPGHKHGPGSGFSSFAGNGSFQSGTSGGNSYATGMSFTASVSTGITLTDNGGNGAHLNVQPTIMMNKIIRAL